MYSTILTMGVYCHTTSVFLLFLTYSCSLSNNYVFCKSVSDMKCPDLCVCLDVIVDCSQKNLGRVPIMPVWTEQLYLSSNNLQDNATELLLELTNLTVVKLKKNILTSLPNLTRSYRLKILDVSYNLITYLNPLVLQALPALNWLDVTGNRIADVKGESFPIRNNINVLNLNANQIKNLQNGCFDNLHKLTVLKLNRNEIENVTKDLFKNQQNLKSLEINRNQLQLISALNFEPLKSLTILKLKRNRISELMDGAFWGLSNVGTLELDGNILTTISKDWLYGLKSLETLSLSNNKITSIVKNSWSACRDLKTLNLSNNRLKMIAKITFDHLSRLKKLILDGNQILTIDEGAFDRTPDLRELELNKNDISSCVENASSMFVNLRRLTRLSLVSNNIRSINHDAFIGLSNLARLDLSGNEIIRVKENAFLPMPNLQDLVINSTHMLCDCDLHWFSRWICRARFVSVNAKCGRPLALRMRLVADLVRDDFSCTVSRLPKIIEHPEARHVARNDDVVLKCKVDVEFPGPIIAAWKRDGIDLPPDLALMNRNGSQATTELMLKSISDVDAGKYQCVVSNDFGSVYSHKAILSVLMYPSFSKVPRNISVEVGDTAKLECAANGQPRPQIAWQKDGGHDFPAAKERRLHMIVMAGEFLIENVTKNDAGIYSCAAHNLAGTVVANASLLVLEKPTFLQPMDRIKIVEMGGTVVLKCAAAGAPRPVITWTKDGNILANTEHHYFLADNKVLVIFNVDSNDSGEYECSLSNEFGTRKGLTRLDVVPIIERTPSDIVSIIIVTATCCAFFTSFVWFVIVRRIQTRAMVVQRASVPDLVYTDDTSERSSCKDSGLGDSAKRSSADLSPAEEVSFVVDDANSTVLEKCETTKFDERTFSRPTNHERFVSSSTPPHETI